jgi:sarcosine oxidase subunit beta
MSRRENGSRDLTTPAQVAVIGGGVMGASIAYHLAREGVDDIIIIDRAHGPGAGSTGRATGGFRAHFATAVNVQLSLMSRRQLLSFEEDTGVNPGYQQVGYLWLASQQSEIDAIRAAHRVQREQGLDEVREIAIDEIAEINPVISRDSLIGGSFCPTDGYIRPLEILRGYLEAGERLGVRFLWDAECVAMDLSQSTVSKVRTTKGDIETEMVVNAAGPWASRIASMGGVPLPVSPLRRQAAFTVPTDAIPPDMPMSIYMTGGFHIRAREGRALLSWPNPESEGEPAELFADESWIDQAAAMMRERVPALSDVAIDRAICYAGLYEMSPDHHAILGLSPHCENMYFANGSSGHGVMHSPAIGSIITDMILKRKPQIDVSMLRPSRFEEGRPVSATELL